MTSAQIESTRTILLRLFRRVLLGLLLLAVLGYLAVTALLYQQQRSLMYFPRPLASTVPADVIFLVGGRKTPAWIANPGQPDAVLYFGGNGESVEAEVEFFRDMLPGRSVYLVPYRGYSGTAGLPTEAGLYADALVEYDQIRTKHGSVALVGRSLGTGIATYVASKRPVERVVLVTPYDSLQNVAQEKYPWMPIGLLLDDKYESWRRAPTLTMPVTLLVAAQDRLIPPAHAEAFARQLPKPPTIVLVDGAGHNDISNRPEYRSALRSALSSK